MSGFTDLCYPMRKYASEHGMTEPTPIQKDGFEALLHTDKHIILSGPTAGGKTFAVYGALLSLVEDFSQRGAKILDILPTKALINDQFGQVSEICDYMYVPVTKWHGDVKQSEKNMVVTVLKKTTGGGCCRHLSWATNYFWSWLMTVEFNLTGQK